MSKYADGAPGEEEIEPGSNGQVLRNKLRITNPIEIGFEESKLLAVAQARSYHQVGTDTVIAVKLIRELHRSWLRPLYWFAGEIRTVNLSKGSVHFAPIQYMESTLRELDKILEGETPCRGKSLKEVVVSIAKVQAELVLVHPFREGNGRVSRWVADLMALQAGLPALKWQFDIDPIDTRQRYFDALSKAFAMDFTSLEAVVRRALDVALRSAEGPIGE